MLETILVLLILLMIVGGLVALESDTMLVAIISVGALGFLRAIAFLMLGAPDLAITQVVVEVVALVILIRATLHRDFAPPAPRPSLVPRVVAVTLLLLVAIVGAGVFRDFPAFGVPGMDRFADTPSGHYLQNGLAETGAANLVTAVILDYRGYDTLGEATVLFVSILGALTILRRRARRGNGHGKEAAPS